MNKCVVLTTFKCSKHISSWYFQHSRWVLLALQNMANGHTKIELAFPLLHQIWCYTSKLKFNIFTSLNSTTHSKHLCWFNQFSYNYFQLQKFQLNMYH